MVSKAEVGRYLENWQDEIESAYLYLALALAEPQPALAEYRKLTATEESHAQFWDDDKMIEIKA